MVACVAGAGGGSDGANGVVVAERRAIDAVVVAVLVFDEELLCAVAARNIEQALSDFVPRNMAVGGAGVQARAACWQAGKVALAAVF